MRNWYARHFYTSRPGYLEWIKAGRPETKEWKNRHAIISWLIWGGEPGLRWMNSEKILKDLNKYFDKNYKKIE